MFGNGGREIPRERNMYNSVGILYKTWTFEKVYDVITLHNSSISNFFTRGHGPTLTIMFSKEMSFKLDDPHDHLSKRLRRPLQSDSAYRMTHPKGSTEEIFFSQTGGRFMQSSCSSPIFNLMYRPKRYKSYMNL